MSELSGLLARKSIGDCDASSKNRVTILMATYNGARFLPDQLASIARQTHRNWSLIVSDDGSVDGNCQIVREFGQTQTTNRVLLLRGPGMGSAQNFLSLLRVAGQSSFVAFCDQDDVWHPNKIQRALQTLSGNPDAAIYGSRTIIADSGLLPHRRSARSKRAPSFGNALVQNVIPGNTMVINRKALDILQPASSAAAAIVAHDWWCYQIIAGVGGRIISDAKPQLIYRQHDRNVIGANLGVRSKLARFKGLLRGDLATWMDRQLNAMQSTKIDFTAQNQRQMETLMSAPKTGSRKRYLALKRAKVRRQRFIETILVYLVLCVIS
ncbi:MAG: glycosyltransferase [Boseongicola sp.]|nr:MAG: glycosyltransferase [Boseongicola sp.]